MDMHTVYRWVVLWYPPGDTNPVIIDWCQRICFMLGKERRRPLNLRLPSHEAFSPNGWALMMPGRKNASHDKKDSIESYMSRPTSLAKSGRTCDETIKILERRLFTAHLIHGGNFDGRVQILEGISMAEPRFWTEFRWCTVMLRSTNCVCPQEIARPKKMWIWMLLDESQWIYSNSIETNSQPFRRNHSKSGCESSVRWWIDVNPIAFVPTSWNCRQWRSQQQPQTPIRRPGNRFDVQRLTLVLAVWNLGDAIGPNHSEVNLLEKKLTQLRKQDNPVKEFWRF